MKDTSNQVVSELVHDTYMYSKPAQRLSATRKHCRSSRAQLGRQCPLSLWVLTAAPSRHSAQHAVDSGPHRHGASTKNVPLEAGNASLKTVKKPVGYRVRPTSQAVIGLLRGAPEVICLRPSPATRCGTNGPRDLSEPEFPATRRVPHLSPDCYRRRQPEIKRAICGLKRGVRSGQGHERSRSPATGPESL